MILDENSVLGKYFRVLRAWSNIENCEDDADS